MATKFTPRPLGNVLIIVPDERVTVSKGGIILPDKSQAAPATGRVIAVGPGLATGFDEKVIPVVVKPGDHICYLRHGLLSMEAHGQVISTVSEGDVLFIMDPCEDSEEDETPVTPTTGPETEEIEGIGKGFILTVPTTEEN